MFHTAKGRGNDKKGRDGKSRPVKDLMAEPTRLELATSGVTVRCANQLHHGSAPLSILVGGTGLEPVTPCV